MYDDREEKNKSELDKLFAEVKAYKETRNYGEMLNFIGRFRDIAPFNLMLVQIQKPGSRYIATAEDWRIRFDRRPKPGARPLVIMHPFGPVRFVYELSDTEGKDFPQKLLNPFRAKADKKEISERQLEKFIRNNLYLNGFAVRPENYGTNLAGRVQTLNILGTHNEKRFRLPFAITINQNHDPVTRFATIYHELGHVYCGHLYNPNVKYLPKCYNLPGQIEEFEAESVCWLLCERHGIENPSAEYLSSYLDKNAEIPDISIDTVLKAVKAIENLRDNDIHAPRKELRLDKS